MLYVIIACQANKTNALHTVFHFLCKYLSVLFAECICTVLKIMMMISCIKSVVNILYQQMVVELYICAVCLYVICMLCSLCVFITHVVTVV